MKFKSFVFYHEKLKYILFGYLVFFFLSTNMNALIVYIDLWYLLKVLKICRISH